MATVILGFAGTRQGMTAAQRGAIREMLMGLLEKPERVLHGGAIGADGEFDQAVADVFGIAHYDHPEDGVICEVYPASGERFSFWRWRDRAFRFVHSPLDPLKRHRIIVNRADRMIACPAEAQEQPRGGTWSTIRYSRKVGKPPVVVGPSGKVISGMTALALVLCVGAGPAMAWDVLQKPDCARRGVAGAGK